MNITIRKATFNDWKIVQKLNNEVFLVDAPHDPHLDMTWPFSETGISHYKRFVTSPEFMTFIAYADENPVGHIVGGPKEISYRKIKMAEIIEIGVTPSHRSMGIGALLIDKLREWCRQNGYKKLFVNAYYKNEKAIAFYRKQGLEPIDISLETDV